MSPEHVLVTGAAGLIGGIVSAALSDEFAVHRLDVVAAPGVEWVADMTKLDEIQSGFDGMSAVLDLAANPSLSASWETVRENNIPATLNAFEAARRAGVRRVVFASSNHVVGVYERDEPYASVVAGEYDGLDPGKLPRLAADVPIRPDSAYGVGKAFGEAVGRYYSEEYEISVSCIRIGTVNRANRPATRRHFATLLTHRDLVHLARCCLIAAPSPGFRVLYGVSANTWRIWDIDEARMSVGYMPEDDAEQFR